MCIQIKNKKLNFLEKPATFRLGNKNMHISKTVQNKLFPKGRKVSMFNAQDFHALHDLRESIFIIYKLLCMELKQDKKVDVERKTIIMYLTTMGK